MFEDLLPHLVTLALLTLLQAVLGFDNLLYISLESKRAPADKRKAVRLWGIGIAIFLRIALLFVLINVISYFQNPFWIVGEPIVAHESGIVSEVVEAEGVGAETHTADSGEVAAAGESGSWFSISLNLHALIVLIGGAFILYTATKEVLHMMRIEEDHGEDAKPRSVASVVTWIVVMNVVFSFDSILSAMALAQEKVLVNGKLEIDYIEWVMVVAIVLSGLMMIWLADRVSTFLEKNRMYEVLGLFILFVVGIMLLTEGGHLAHLSFFGNPIHSMSKTTFYFVIAVLVLTDIVQSRYQKNLMAKAKRLKNAGTTHA